MNKGITHYFKFMKIKNTENSLQNKRWKHVLLWRLRTYNMILKQTVVFYVFFFVILYIFKWIFLTLFKIFKIFFIYIVKKNLS